MEISRRTTRAVKAGSLIIGGGFPISVQSMANTDTRDPEATLSQILRLAEAGCSLVRLAVPDSAAAAALVRIVPQSQVPICADIHFDYRLAISAIEAGVSKVRINPGNIGSEGKVAEVVAAAKDKSVPIRIGVNSGSVAPSIAMKYGRGAKALAESALQELSVFERLGFYDTVLSVKSSDVLETVEANRLLSSAVDYPLHLGVTEAGPSDTGLVRTSAALGALILEGIGDTIRFSLTGDPVAEVLAGKELLTSLRLMRGLRIISCPTCGRTRGDVEGMVAELREGISALGIDATVAVMGCEVNGPGEASGADFGIACGKDTATVFRGGEVVARVPLNDAASYLIGMIRQAGLGEDGR